MNKLLEDHIAEEPVNAASVILLRDHHNTLQTLLLCRANSRTVMNSAWVFPGGKLDDLDLRDTDSVQDSVQSKLAADARELLNEPDLNPSLAAALFVTACRETLEETGVQLKAPQLRTWSRWVTPNEPSMMKKRFDARFFVAKLPDGQNAAHDGVEATDSQWITARDALKSYATLKIALAPPQIMTLIALTKFNNAQECIDHATHNTAYTIKPHVIKTEGSRTLTYPGDPSHPDELQQMPGPTRLVWQQDHFEPPEGFNAYIDL